MIALSLAVLSGSPALAATGAPIPPLDLGPAFLSATNDRGDIVGYSRDLDNDTGSYVLWHHSGYAKTELGLGDDAYPPSAVNNRGEVVGHLGGGPGYLWRDGRIERLEHPDGGGVYPSGINDIGQVIGLRTVEAAPTRPFVWQNGVFTDLGPFNGLLTGRAIAINNRGQVIANLWATDHSTQRALIWRRGAWTDLGSLGGTQTWATAINDRGMVIGNSEDATGTPRPFLWRDGRMINLLPDAGNQDSWALAINEAGDVVGYVDNRPALWRNGRLLDFLPGKSGPATAINDRGDVGGTMRDAQATDQVRAPFRWRHGHTTEFAGLTSLPGTVVSAVDPRGRLIGTCNGEGGATHVVVWIAR